MTFRLINHDERTLVHQLNQSRDSEENNRVTRTQQAESVFRFLRPFLSRPAEQNADLGFGE